MKLQSFVLLPAALPASCKAYARLLPGLKAWHPSSANEKQGVLDRCCSLHSSKSPLPSQLLDKAAEFVPAAELEHAAGTQLAAAGDSHNQACVGCCTPRESGTRIYRPAACAPCSRQFLSVGAKSHSQLWDPRLERSTPNHKTLLKILV